jgi:hypothetical protein
MNGTHASVIRARDAKKLDTSELDLALANHMEECEMKDAEHADEIKALEAAHAEDIKRKDRENADAFGGFAKEYNAKTERNMGKYSAALKKAKTERPYTEADRERAFKDGFDKGSSWMRVELKDVTEANADLVKANADLVKANEDLAAILRNAAATLARD